MKRLIELPLEDGTTILVEVDKSELKGSPGRVARLGDVFKTDIPFEQALSEIRPVAETIINHLQGLRNQPDEVSVEFSFKLNGKANIIIASADAEGNFKVTLTCCQLYANYFQENFRA